MNLEIKGKGSVGVAVSYYALRGMVSLPMEPGDYNLIFDNAGDLFRIKVVSCSFKTKYGIYAACIRTSGGNQPNTSVKKFNPASCDAVFVVTADLDMYEIPSHEITSTRQISLSSYSRFKVSIIPG